MFVSEPLQLGAAKTSPIMWGLKIANPQAAKTARDNLLNEREI